MVQIAIFDTIGAIAFLISFFFAFKNYKETREVSIYWMMLSVAMLLGFVWSSTVALEWFDFYPQVMDEIEQAIVASAATAFAIAGLQTVLSPIKPLD